LAKSAAAAGVARAPGIDPDDRRVHVLALVDHLTGGAERFARFVTLDLDPERYRRTLCATRGSDPDEEERVRTEVEEAGATFLLLGRRSRVDLRPWAELVRYLRTQRVDILHAHKFGSNLWASLIKAARPGMITIAHEHTWSYEGQPVRRLLDRWVISRRCDRFVAVSQLDRQRMIEVEHIDPERIVIVPVGIPDLTPTGRDVRPDLGIAAEAPVIVSVGYLRPQKALEVLLEAAAELRPRHSSLRVLIVGDGEERAKLEGLIDSRGLRNVVSILGHRRDVMDIVTTADVTVCCSDFEGTPQAVIEYMAAGKPVVATRVGGLPDLVEDGVSGILVEPRSPGALAEAVDGLLAQPDHAREMGRNGRARQRAELTLGATMREIDALYQALLTERGAKR
jgi:glycosyltransferase involved in cell wall biosynthesis